MSETLATKEEKQKLEELSDSTSADSSSKKGSKKKNKTSKTAPLPENNQDLQKLIDERLKALGMGESIEDDKEWKAIKKSYKSLQKLTLASFYPGLPQEERLKKLVEAYNNLANTNNSLEEHNYIFTKVHPTFRMERDQYHGDNVRQGQIKTELEKGCREIQKHNTTIKDFNKKFVSEETKKREELIANFENTIKEVTEKTAAQKTQAEEFAAENLKLRADLEERIKKFEAREKEFFDQLKGIDDQNEVKTKDILTKLKDIEVHAKKTFELKDEIQKIKARETEAKFKCAIYSQRVPDFDRTLASTNEMLARFKSELEKSGQKLRSLQKVNKELKEKATNVDEAVLKLVVLNNEVKSNLEVSRKSKEELRKRLTGLQEQITAKKKELEALEKKA